MEQGRVDPLQPARALVDEVLVEPHQHPCVQHVGRRDPRLRHPSIDEQLAEMTGVGPICLGPTLLAAQRRRLRRLSDMRRHARPHELFNDIPPARTPLQRERDVIDPVGTAPTRHATGRGRQEQPARYAPRRWPGPRSRTSAGLDGCRYLPTIVTITSNGTAEAPSSTSAPPHAILVMWPRWVWASDSRSRGVSPAHEHSRRGLSNRRHVTDLGDEHRGQHRADTAQRLDRLVAGMTLQAAMDAGVALRDLAVVELDQVAQRLDPIDVDVGQLQLVEPRAARRHARSQSSSGITPSLPSV